MNTITPETERTSHYFWAFMRNYRLDSQLITTQLREGVRNVFAEDEAMLAAQQAAIDANPDHEFYSLNIDAGGMWVRRILDRMLDGRGARRRTVADPRDDHRATSPTGGPGGSSASDAGRARRTPDHRRAPRRGGAPRRAATSTSGCRLGRHDRRPVLLRRGVRATTAAGSPSACCGRRSRAAARSFMHGLAAGDELEVTQPLQNFPLRVGAPRYVLLAGGIGITALVGMASVLRHVRSRLHARLRRPQPRPDGLRRRAGRAARRPAGPPRRRRGRAAGRGRRSSRSVAGHGAGATELYMCGPIRLMDAVRRTWARRRAPAGQPALRDLRQQRLVRARRSSRSRIPRLAGRDDRRRRRDHARGADPTPGVDLMYDCRKGECGLCPLDARACGGRSLDHRDVFLSAAQQATDLTLCTCVSRIAAPPGAGRATVSLSLP